MLLWGPLAVVDNVIALGHDVGTGREGRTRKQEDPAPTKKAGHREKWGTGS